MDCKKKIKDFLVRQQTVLFVSLVAMGFFIVFVPLAKGVHFVAEGIAFIISGIVGLIMSFAAGEIGQSIKVSLNRIEGALQTNQKETVDILREIRDAILSGNRRNGIDA